MVSLSEQVRLWRNAMNLSQGEIESRAGLAHNALSRIENEQVTSPRLDTLQKIADAMGIHVEQLMNARPPLSKKRPSKTIEPCVQELAAQISNLPAHKKSAVIEALNHILRAIQE